MLSSRVMNAIPCTHPHPVGPVVTEAPHQAMRGGGAFVERKQFGGVTSGLILCIFTYFIGGFLLDFFCCPMQEADGCNSCFCPRFDLKAAKREYKITLGLFLIFIFVYVVDIYLKIHGR